MRFVLFKNTLFILVLVITSCGSGTKNENAYKSDDIVAVDSISITPDQKRKDPVVAADRMDQYGHLIKGKKLGIVANQTSIVSSPLPDQSTISKDFQTHLVDHLQYFFKDQIVRVFAPEHGFRGTADAGELVEDGVDVKTGLPIISLHGKNKKPTEDQLEGIEMMVFDIQDVGVRFYTYISTMHYVMEACAEKGIPVLILDRPNPNGHYIDGPMMEKENTGFLGLHPVPLVHGMTIGEYARMINGEGWLKDGVKCELVVIPVMNYSKDYQYSIPVRPSPNLPNDTAINLYPSLGLLEGTNMNAGRGTEMQFQILGSPYLPEDSYPFKYTPEPNFGSKNPKHKGIECNGMDLRKTPRMSSVDLSWIIDAYHKHEKQDKFFNTANFTAHAGTAKLQEMIEAGASFDEIKASWKKGLEAYDKMRQPYLLYD